MNTTITTLNLPVLLNTFLMPAAVASTQRVQTELRELCHQVRVSRGRWGTAKSRSCVCYLMPGFLKVAGHGLRQLGNAAISLCHQNAIRVEVSSVQLHIDLRRMNLATPL